MRATKTRTDQSHNFKLKKQGSLRSDICLGDGSVSIEHLMNHCRMGQGAIILLVLCDCDLTLSSYFADYALTLQSPDHKRSIGTLRLHLQMKENTSQGSSKIVDSREVIENARDKLFQSLNVEYPQGTSGPSSSSPPNIVGAESSEPSGLQALSRIQRRLGSMRSGNLRASLDLVDKAAKVFIFDYMYMRRLD